MDLDEISYAIIGGAMDVHSALGPGLLESTYEACLHYELKARGLEVRSQVGLPVLYKEIQLETGYRVDLIVEKQVIVELKSVETILPVHKAQLHSYLKLSGYRLGLLINFNVHMLKDGIVRRTNM